MNASKTTGKTVAVLAKSTGLDADEMVVERDRREAETSVTFDAAVANWLELAQAMMNAHYSEKHTFGCRLILDSGRRYVRVWRLDTLGGEVISNQGKGSAYAFLDKLTGNVHKPDGWKKPAKLSRGNVWDKNPIAMCGPYGVATFR